MEISLPNLSTPRNEVLNNNSTTQKTESQIIEIKKILELDYLHQQNISSILVLSDKRIVTGSEYSISICSINYLFNNWELLITKKNAHDDYVSYLTELPNKRLASCSNDHIIKTWDISLLSSLILITVIEEHTSWVFQVIHLTNNRIASNSYDMSVKLWNDIVFTQIQTTFETQDDTPISILQLTKQDEILCICCSSWDHSDGNLSFYSLKDNYVKTGKINGVFTSWKNGLKELSNGNIAVSKRKPSPSIILIDYNNLQILNEIVDNNYIKTEGALCLIDENNFLYSWGGLFCCISYKDNKYEIVSRFTKSKYEIDGCAIAVIENGKYLIVSTDNGRRSIILFKCVYDNIKK